MGGCRILKQLRSSFEVLPSNFEVEKFRSVHWLHFGYKIPRHHRFSIQNPPSEPPEIPKTTILHRIFFSQVREGGRTVA